MIQIEFLGTKAGAPRPPEARTASGDRSFLDVLRREAGRPGETASAARAAEAAESEDGTVDLAKVADDDLEPKETAAPDAEGEPVSGGTVQDPPTAHDDRVAAAIAAADPAATGETPDGHPDAGMAEAGAMALRKGEAALPPAAGATPSAGDVLPRQPGAGPSARAPAAGGAPSAGPTVAATEPATAQTPPGAGAAAAVGPAASAMDVRGGGGVDASASPIARGGDQPAGAAAVAPEASGAALFAAEGARIAPDLPERRAAYTAGAGAEVVARVPPMAAAASLAQLPAQVASPAGAEAATIAAAVETATDAAPGPIARDEAALASVTTPAAQVRGGAGFFVGAEPARVAQQMAEAVRRGSDGSIELALSPKELGSVRMTIQTTEAGTAIVMTAERDETMQLLRRHAEMLHEAFRDLGLGTLDLSFGGRDGRPARPDGEAPAAGAASADAAETTRMPPTRAASGGLDLRM